MVAVPDNGPYPWELCPFVVECEEHGVIGAYQTARLAEEYRNLHRQEKHPSGVRVRYQPEDLHEQ